MQVFKPEGEVELSGGEVAGGDEAEDGVLDLGWKLGKGVAGAGAGDNVELIEAKLIVDGKRGRRSQWQSFPGTGGEGGVDAGCKALRFGAKNESGDGLQGGELGMTEILCDIDGAAVDELLEAQARGGLGGAVRGDNVRVFGGDGHDTTLLVMRHARLTFVYSLDAGNERKSLFRKAKILPQRWYVDLGDLVAGVDNEALICISMTMQEAGFSEETVDDGGT